MRDKTDLCRYSYCWRSIHSQSQPDSRRIADTSPDRSFETSLRSQIEIAHSQLPRPNIEERTIPPFARAEFACAESLRTCGVIFSVVQLRLANPLINGVVLGYSSRPCTVYDPVSKSPTRLSLDSAEDFLLTDQASARTIWFHR